MKQFKSILVTHSLYRAGRDRACYHSKDHSIAKGDVVLQLELIGATKGYCAACATAMIQRAIRDLAFLQGQLSNPAPDETSFELMKKQFAKQPIQ